MAKKEKEEKKKGIFLWFLVGAAAVAVAIASTSKKKTPTDTGQLKVKVCNPLNISLEIKSIDGTTIGKKETFDLSTEPDKFVLFSLPVGNYYVSASDPAGVMSEQLLGAFNVVSGKTTETDCIDLSGVPPVQLGEITILTVDDLNAPLANVVFNISLDGNPYQSNLPSDSKGSWVIITNKVGKFKITSAVLSGYTFDNTQGTIEGDLIAGGKLTLKAVLKKGGGVCTPSCTGTLTAPADSISGQNVTLVVDVSDTNNCGTPLTWKLFAKGTLYQIGSFINSDTVNITWKPMSGGDNQLDLEVCGVIKDTKHVLVGAGKGYVQIVCEPPEVYPLDITFTNEGGGPSSSVTADYGDVFELDAGYSYFITMVSQNAGWLPEDFGSLFVNTNMTAVNPYQIANQIDPIPPFDGCVTIYSNVLGFNYEIDGALGNKQGFCSGSQCTQCELPVASSGATVYDIIATKPGYITDNTQQAWFTPTTLNYAVTVDLQPEGAHLTFTKISDCSNGNTLFAFDFYVEGIYKGSFGTGDTVEVLPGNGVDYTIKKNGYNDEPGKYSVGVGNTTPINDCLTPKTPSKKKVIVMYPYYAIDNNGKPCDGKPINDPGCCQGIINDKDIAADLVTYLNNFKSGVSATLSGSRCYDDAVSWSETNVIIMIGGPWGWNDCNGWYADGCESYAELGWSGVGCKKNTTKHAPTVIYGLSGNDGQGTIAEKDKFISKLNATGSNIDTINC